MIDLDPGWLQIELDAVEEEISEWPDGLKESFDSLESE